jgi:hypothetical protein
MTTKVRRCLAATDFDPAQIDSDLERLRAAARWSVSDEWAVYRIRIVAEALLQHGSLRGEEIRDLWTAGLPGHAGAALLAVIAAAQAAARTRASRRAGPPVLMRSASLTGNQVRACASPCTHQMPRFLRCAMTAASERSGGT